MSQTNINQEMVESIQRLSAELTESSEFYEAAIQNAHETRLKDLFERRAQQRVSFIEELDADLQRYSDAELDEEEEQPLLTLEESLQRGLMTVKAAMTIERDKTDEMLLQECQEAEKRLLATYKELLDSHEWPTGIKATLSHQYEQVQAAHAYIDTTYNRADWAIVLGLFKQTAVKQKALIALKSSGFEDDDIGVVSQDDEEKTDVAEAMREDVQETTAETAGAGAISGGAVGSVIGLTAGAGVALVTGPLIAALGITAIGAGIGATYGGIFGSLIGMGVGEEDVHRYLEGIRRGETLVAVRTSPNQAAEAAGILREHDASSVMVRHDSFGEQVFEAQEDGER
jgi:uncharacterized protein (TIGR02284 family)